MTVTCSACGYDKNPKGTDYCDACGSEIAVASGSPDVEEPTSVPTKSFPSERGSFSSNGEVLDEPAIPSPPIPEPTFPEPQAEDIDTDPIVPTPMPVRSAVGGLAKLKPKQAGAPIAEFAIENGIAVIGIFDPDTGPVDIDLEGFSGHEMVSRNHAEIYQEGTEWKIKDLGSTNGVFIRPVGQSRFNSRVTVPTVVNSGDEIAIAKIILLFSGS